MSVLLLLLLLELLALLGVFLFQLLHFLLLLLLDLPLFCLVGILLPELFLLLSLLLLQLLVLLILLLLQLLDLLLVFLLELWVHGLDRTRGGRPVILRVALLAFVLTFDGWLLFIGAECWCWRGSRSCSADSHSAAWHDSPGAEC